MKRMITVLLMLIVLSGQAWAQDAAKPDMPKFECIKDDTADSKYFSDIQAFARKIDKDACAAILVPTRSSVADVLTKEDLAAFGGLVEEKAAKVLENINLPKMKEQLDYFKATLQTGKKYPALNVDESGGPRDKKHVFFFTGNSVHEGTLTEQDYGKCEAELSLKVSCLTVLKDLSNAIFPYQRNANAVTAYETEAKLSVLSKEWDSYFETARAQSFADIALTSVFEKNHFKKGYLVGPPKRQWFALHPNIVMEYVGGAPAGERLNSAFVIEWIGVNWWEDMFVGIPVGLSLASLYSDRPEVNGVGQGVILYLDNKYSLGYARHGSENGYYISLDLLKLFEDKKEQAGRYRDSIKDIMNNELQTRKAD